MRTFQSGLSNPGGGKIVHPYFCSTMRVREEEFWSPTKGIGELLRKEGLEGRFIGINEEGVKRSLLLGVCKSGFKPGL